METLEHLRWEFGELLCVPAEVYEMRNLQRLRLVSNSIAEVSPSIGALRRPDEIDFSNNEMRNLPPELGLLKVRSLGFEGN
jgi:Leucine-rich repeat (LRR) protein